MVKTIAYDGDVEGWTSFYTFSPETMVRLNNKFYTIKGGQVFEHHSEDVPRNNFYGVQYPSKLQFPVNEAPSDIKVFKALGIEASQPWQVAIQAYQSSTDDFTESSLADVDFIKKEGYWYAYCRRNEVEGDNSSKASYGLGIVQSDSGNDITLTAVNSSMSVGDKVFKLDDDSVVGTIEGVLGMTVTLDSPASGLTGQFLYAQKDMRIEGAELRGYTARIDMEVDTPEKVELYAVNTEVFKSYQ
jgi:hypothetical protein